MKENKHRCIFCENDKISIFIIVGSAIAYVVVAILLIMLICYGPKRKGRGFNNDENNMRYLPRSK
jgi:predicted RND superfamily exporter protein